jgi:predicted transcriptional regulator
MSIVTENVKDLMAEWSMTQTDLAKNLDVTQASISQYLTERIPTNTDFVLRVARLFNVNAYHIDPDLERFKGLL